MIEDIEATVRQWARDHDYPDEALRKYGVGEPRLVLVGEDHCFQRFGEDQLSLYTLIMPSHFFHEGLGDMIYDSRATHVFVSPNTTRKEKIFERKIHDRINEKNLTFTVAIEDYNAFVHSAYARNLRFFVDAESPFDGLLMGPDLSMKEQRDLDKMTTGIKNGVCIKYAVRESRMARKFLEYFSGDIILPSLAIVGAGHVRDPQYDTCKTKSAIHLLLQEHAISYICIDQTKHPSYDQREYKASLVRDCL